jgi:hypothetical protein
LRVQAGFEGQAFDNQLIAALLVESGDAGHQVADGLQRLGVGGTRTFFWRRPSPSHCTVWSTSTASDMRFTTPCGMRVVRTVRLVW